MKTQMSQTVLCDNVVETPCHIFRREKLAEIITADEAFKLRVVGFSADFFEVSFKLFLLKEHFLNVRYQRKCSSGGVGFQSRFHEQLSVTVLIVVTDDLALNGNRLVDKVHSVPPQTEYLTAAQTIVSGNVYHQFKPVTPEHIKQLIQLFLVIECSFILILKALAISNKK